MARESGKFGRLLMALAVPTKITSEAATLNVGTVTIGNQIFAANTIATLANKNVIPDSVDDPITVTFAIGTGSAIPSDVGFVVDHVNGRIFISPALTTGNTVTVSYSHAGSLTEMADLTDWNVDESLKDLDVTAFNDMWEQYTPLQKSWTATVTGLLNFNFFDTAVGATVPGSVARPVPVYLKLFKNRNAVGATNPVLAGMGYGSFSMKVPYAGKVEFTAKVRGTGELAKQTS